MDFINDKAIVNIPLHKRGDIDKQIDKHKEQERQKEQADVEWRKYHRSENRAIVRDGITLLKHYPRHKLQKLADGQGISITEARNRISMALSLKPVDIAQALAKDLAQYFDPDNPYPSEVMGLVSKYGGDLYKHSGG